jgi:hypothetical protein
MNFLINLVKAYNIHVIGTKVGNDITFVNTTKETKKKYYRTEQYEETDQILKAGKNVFTPSSRKVRNIFEDSDAAEFNRIAQLIEEKQFTQTGERLQLNELFGGFHGKAVTEQHYIPIRDKDGNISKMQVEKNSYDEKGTLTKVKQPAISEIILYFIPAEEIMSCTSEEDFEQLKSLYIDAEKAKISTLNYWVKKTEADIKANSTEVEP